MGGLWTSGATFWSGKACKHQRASAKQDRMETKRPWLMQPGGSRTPRAPRIGINIRQGGPGRAMADCGVCSYARIAWPTSERPQTHVNTHMCAHRLCYACHTRMSHPCVQVEGRLQARHRRVSNARLGTSNPCCRWFVLHVQGVLECSAARDALVAAPANPSGGVDRPTDGRGHQHSK